MLLHRAFQRAGGWCEPVPMEEKQPHSRVDSAKNTSIRVVEYGCPGIGFGLHWSPRVTDCRKTSVSKVVPRIVHSSLRLLSFKDFFMLSHKTLRKDRIYILFKERGGTTWTKLESATLP